MMTLMMKQLMRLTMRLLWTVVVGLYAFGMFEMVQSQKQMMRQGKDSVRRQRAAGGASIRRSVELLTWVTDSSSLAWQSSSPTFKVVEASPFLPLRSDTPQSGKKTKREQRTESATTAHMRQTLSSHRRRRRRRRLNAATAIDTKDSTSLRLKSSTSRRLNSTTVVVATNSTANNSTATGNALNATSSPVSTTNSTASPTIGTSRNSTNSTVAVASPTSNATVSSNSTPPPTTPETETETETGPGRIPPRKPLENDCPFDAKGTGEVTLEMSSSSVTVVLVTTMQTAVIIPPPPTSTTTNDSNSTSNQGPSTEDDKDDTTSLWNATNAIDNTNGTLEPPPPHPNQPSLQSSSSSLYLPSSTIVCTFPDHGDLSFVTDTANTANGYDGATLLYTPHANFVGTDTMVVQRHCQNRARRQPPSNPDSDPNSDSDSDRREPPSSFVSFDDNAYNSSSTNPDDQPLFNQTVVFCIVEFISVEVVAAVGTAAEPSDLTNSKSNDENDPTTTTIIVSSIAAVLIVVLAVICILLFCHIKSMQRIRDKDAADRNAVALETAHAAATDNQRESTSAQSPTSSSPGQLVPVEESRLPASSAFYVPDHHNTASARRNRSRTPSPIMSPSVALSSSTLTSLDGGGTLASSGPTRATVMASVHVTFPSYKDQIRQASDGDVVSNHNNSSSNDDLTNSSPPPLRSRTPSNETLDDVSNDELNQIALASVPAAAGTTVIAMPVATAVGFEEHTTQDAPVAMAAAAAPDPVNLAPAAISEALNDC